MTDDDTTIDLSRRKVLGGLGGIGVASAGAALGTSAYFSDQESFENNVLSAGTLDLKVDWEEHYSYPQIYGFDDPTTELDVTRSEPEDSENYQPLPAPENPAVWVHLDDLSTYMDNTAIEAYPDPDDDGVQDDFGTGQVGPACEDGADMSEDLDPAGLRTDNDDTAGGAPLVNLQDVKPGDFGELTLSYHLCDNPGYVWLNGELVEASEGGVTEPEGDSPDEEEGVVELLDEIEATVWYDGDCDNVFEPGGDEGEEGVAADVVLTLDRSGSMGGDKIDSAKSGAKSLVDALGPNDQVSLVSFSNSPSLDAGLTLDHDSVKDEIDDITAGGGTDMDEGVEQSHEEILSEDTFGGTYPESGNARSSARKIMIVLGDGQADADTEATAAKDDGIELFTIAYGSDADTTELESMASDPAANPEDQYFFEADISDIEDLLQSLGGTVGTAGEESITSGSLRDVLDLLENGDGIPLDGDLEAEGHQCHPAMQTHCVGLSWHLPAAVGNHVQSDSVSFDVGFYTEQCRNNDVSVSEPQ